MLICWSGVEYSTKRGATAWAEAAKPIPSTFIHLISTESLNTSPRYHFHSNQSPSRERHFAIGQFFSKGGRYETSNHFASGNRASTLAWSSRQRNGKLVYDSRGCTSESVRQEQ